MDLYERFRERREEVAYYMRRLYQQGLTTCSGGNISCRVDDRHVLLTPSALDKGVLTADQVLLATIDGENLSPHLKPTLETGMHLAVLRRRPDVHGVVHAHPPFGTAFACLDRPVDTALSCEAYLHMPRVGYAGFAAPGTEELAEFVADALADADVALIRSHGVIAAGKNLYSAFDRMETMENVAKVSVIAQAMGGAVPMTPAQCEAINIAFSK